MSIAANLAAIKKELPKEVTLVAVSKTMSNASILEAYGSGQRIFGENKVQEMTQKWEALPKDIQWHMIGHVQRNKVKYMAPYVALIHGVDSLRLLKEIDKQAKNCQRTIPCLLQVHIAEEDTKFGFDENELDALIRGHALTELKNVAIKGLMGMATFTDDTEHVRREFNGLNRLFHRLRTRIQDMEILSMGMSGDYKIAIAEGSTMVRVGSLIFGART